MKTLYVVTAVVNPCRYKSRYHLYRDFKRHVAASGAKLLTVEVAFGERPFECEPDVGLRTEHELWLKENLWNIGVSRLPADAEYIATVDADFAFARPDWAEETVHQLQHYRVVQLFSDVHYLGPKYEVVKRSPGFAFQHLNGGTCRGKYGEWGAPGGAWAYHRDDFAAMGGLLDTCILGSADHFMAEGIVGRAAWGLERFSPGYQRAIRTWMTRALRTLRKDMGYVSGSAMHHWHGSLKSRGYGVRDQILIRSHFDPYADLRRDNQGVWALEDDGGERLRGLRDDLRTYFRARNEDSIDV